MEKKIILCQGGLGDHLSLSTLPEEFAKQGFEVYLSSFNIHRNTEIYNLVWSINPYISGFSSETPNSGHVIPITYTNLPFIQAVENNQGIFNSGNKYPKIYREHNLIEALKDKTILNLESISANYDKDDVIKKVEELLKTLNIDVKDILKIKTVQDPNIFVGCFISNKPVSIINMPYDEYNVNDINEYCDVIYSCKNYITLHSGGASLAAAIRDKNTYVIMNETLSNTYDINCFIFDNQTYIF
jgi:hypothetical protein